MKKPFSRALIFSGGGTRFALYGGMYEALEEHGFEPDVLIASCGGAVTATVINAFSNNQQRKDYLCSDEFYHFIKQTSLTPYRKLHKIGKLILKKQLESKNAPFIEDVFNRYLVEMPQDIGNSLPTLREVSFNEKIPTIIIGSKLLFSPKDIGKERQGRKLYQKVLMTNSKTANLIDPQSIKIESDNYKNSAVTDEILIKTNITMQDAVRISIADMFYVAPVLFENDYFAGGAIDLVPLELANSLADDIYIEKKQRYKSSEEALVRAVLGFSGNNRLDEIEKYDIKNQIDTQDASTLLKGYYCEKYIDWKNFEVGIKLPKSYLKFKEDVQKQWDYGYERTIKSLNL